MESIFLIKQMCYISSLRCKKLTCAYLIHRQLNYFRILRIYSHPKRSDCFKGIDCQCAKPHLPCTLSKITLSTTRCRRQPISPLCIHPSRTRTIVSLTIHFNTYNPSQAVWRRWHARMRGAIMPCLNFLVTFFFQEKKVKTRTCFQQAHLQHLRTMQLLKQLTLS
jgi:hypothetical protein